MFLQRETLLQSLFYFKYGHLEEGKVNQSVFITSQQLILQRKICQLNDNL